MCRRRMSRDGELSELELSKYERGIAFYKNTPLSGDGATRCDAISPWRERDRAESLDPSSMTVARITRRARLIGLDFSGCQVG